MDAVALLHHAEGDDVGGRADRGDVAAEAGSEEHGPAQRAEIGVVGDEVVDDGDEGGDEDDVVDEGGADGGHRDDERGEDEAVRAERLGEAAGEHVGDAGGLESAGDGEEDEEEDERPPLDFGLDVVARALAAVDHEDARDGQRGDDEHGVGGEAEARFDRAVQGDEDEGADEDDEAAAVGDAHERAEAEVAGAALGEAVVEQGDVFARPEHEQEHRDEEVEQHDRRRVGEELREGEAGLGADEQADGVAEHRAGGADVRGEHADEDELDGLELERVADLEDEGEDEDDGGDFVDEAGQDAGHERERGDETLAGHVTGVEDELDEPGEEAEILEDADERHHAHEEEDDVQLRLLHHLRQRGDVGREHHGDADEGHGQAQLPEEQGGQDDDDERHHGDDLVRGDGQRRASHQGGQPADEAGGGGHEEDLEGGGG